MNLRPMWSVVVVIKYISRRGDRWVAFSEGKVILINSNRHKMEVGMTVPVLIDKEIETCSFGHVETGVWIDGRGAWLPIDTDFMDEDAVHRASKIIKAKWDAANEEHHKKAEVWKVEQAERKLIVDSLLMLETRKYTHQYSSKIKKRSNAPFSKEERRIILQYFGLPPWGVMDCGTYILTDSYTD